MRALESYIQGAEQELATERARLRAAQEALTAQMAESARATAAQEPFRRALAAQEEEAARATASLQAARQDLAAQQAQTASVTAALEITRQVLAGVEKRLREETAKVEQMTAAQAPAPPASQQGPAHDVLALVKQRAACGVAFVGCDAFYGAVAGYAFKLGPMGQGYYNDDACICMQRGDWACETSA